ALIHDLDLIAELAEATGSLAQAKYRDRQLVPHPEQPFADAMLLGGRLAIEFLQGLCEVFEDRRRLAEENLAVAQARHLSIPVLDQVIGLLVSVCAKIHMDIGIGMAAEMQHQGNRVGRTGQCKSVERKTLL